MSSLLDGSDMVPTPMPRIDPIDFRLDGDPIDLTTETLVLSIRTAPVSRNRPPELTLDRTCAQLVAAAASPVVTNYKPFPQPRLMIGQPEHLPYVQTLFQKPTHPGPEQDDDFHKYMA